MKRTGSLKSSPPKRRQISVRTECVADEYLADTLMQRGIAKVRLFEPKEMRGISEQFNRELREDPFATGDGSAYAAKPALSAFGAIGTPTSMHTMLQREITHRASEKVKMALKNFGGKPKFRVLRDRLCVRVPGTSISKESWHRDQHIKVAADRGDITLGGFVSIAGTGQFTCVEETHNTRFDAEGFLKFSKEEMEDLEKRKILYKVEPGEWLMFFQNIAHCVHPGKITTRMERVFIGLNFTDSDELWFTDMLDQISKQKIMHLPSGQIPRMWEKFHLCYHKEKMVKFSAAFSSRIPRNDGYIPAVLEEPEAYGLQNLQMYTDEQKRELMVQDFK